MLPNVPGGRIPRAESACSTFHGSSERLQTSASRSCLLAAAPDCCPPCPQPRLLLDPQGHGPRVERWGAGHWWLSSRDPRVMQGMESRRWLSLLLPALPEPQKPLPFHPTKRHTSSQGHLHSPSQSSTQRSGMEFLFIRCSPGAHTAFSAWTKSWPRAKVMG